MSNRDLLMMYYAMSGGGSPVVSPDTTSISRSTTVGTTCHAGVQYRNDGTEWSNASTGGQSFNVSRGNWLDSGAPGQVWVERVIVSGVLDWLDSGAGRLQLSGTRTFGCLRTTGMGADVAVLDISFWDAAVGGNLIGFVDNLQLTAQVT